MSQLSTVLRDAEDGMLLFWCPGCDGAHGIKHGLGAGPRWSWNGDTDKPTFQPSILVRSYEMSAKGHADAVARYALPEAERPALPEGYRFDGADTVCHSFVADGRIQFLSDCTHALAGQTVELEPWRLLDAGFRPS